MSQFQDTVIQAKRESREYLMQQFELLNQLTSVVSPANFLETHTEVLGIDTKLTSIVELIRYDDFLMQEILRLVETDYRTYLKELCGNKLSAATNHSLVVHVV